MIYLYIFICIFKNGKILFLNFLFPVFTTDVVLRIEIALYSIQGYMLHVVLIIRPLLVHLVSQLGYHERTVGQ